jgi:hypothetical protein
LPSLFAGSSPIRLLKTSFKGIDTDPKLMFIINRQTTPKLRIGKSGISFSVVQFILFLEEKVCDLVINRDEIF